MASWIDIVSLVLTLTAVAALVSGVLYVIRQFSLWVESTKESLKNKGVHVSQHGMSVKTSKRMDREHYMDATQRGLIKALNTSTHGKTGSTESLPSNGPTNSSRPSLVESEKKRHFSFTKKAHVST
ncbi:hypothetical protein B0H21DRAFT_708954 [Amylocystis lapponica]|nr:hypothetical protein B0H21DRAFT_708954 [Amylocystis lapponica]